MSKGKMKVVFAAVLAIVCMMLFAPLSFAHAEIVVGTPSTDMSYLTDVSKMVFVFSGGSNDAGHTGEYSDPFKNIGYAISHMGDKNVIVLLDSVLFDDSDNANAGEFVLNNETGKDIYVIRKVNNTLTTPRPNIFPFFSASVDTFSESVSPTFEINVGEGTNNRIIFDGRV